MLQKEVPHCNVYGGCSALRIGDDPSSSCRLPDLCQYPRKCTKSMADDESTEGASPFEQLLYASKNDSVELAATSLRNPKLGQDVNKADGMGYTGECDP